MMADIIGRVADDIGRYIGIGRTLVHWYVIASNFSSTSDEIWSLDFNGLPSIKNNKLILFYSGRFQL